MSLDQETEKRRAEVKTDAYPMSVGELASVYSSGELNLHPQFQRFFRWSEEQRSRLIESLLLGIPIPSVFLSQQKNGKWDVIDGLQRISTIFQLLGILRDRDGQLVPALNLQATKYLPSLKDKRWPRTDEKPPYSDPNILSEESQLLIKRAKFDLKIVLRESSESSKYELFQRLNGGGTPTSDQEVRNCMLIMANQEFYEWVEALSKEKNFRVCVSLSEREEDEQYALELVTRFLVFRNMHQSKLGAFNDLKELLDAEILRLAEQSDYDRASEEKAFKRTFSILADTAGEDAFRRYDATKKRFLGKFLISAFEAIAIGIGNGCLADDFVDDKAKVLRKMRRLWSMPTFLEGIGSGVRASTRIPVAIAAGRRLFSA